MKATIENLPGELQILAPLTKFPEYQELLNPDFFSTEITGISSPLKLPDMEKGVEFLKEAIHEKKEIMVFGDRDVDGVASTALLGRFLGDIHEKNGNGNLHLQVSEGDESYGLVDQLLKTAIGLKNGLIILLDMGTSNGPEINELIANGNKVILLDHHMLQVNIPDNTNCAFINPMRVNDDCAYHGKVSTTAIVFKFMLGYALSFTKEWYTCYFLFPESEREKPHLNGKCGYLFRMGHFLGEFPSLAAAESFFEKNYETTSYHVKSIDPATHHRFRMSEIEIAELKHNPADAGKILLSRQICSRPRLTEFVREMSDLAALGIITDMMPLVGENRALVRIGIGLAGYKNKSGMREYRPGYATLIHGLGLRQGRILSRDMGWSLGPALNAAGRMGKTTLALELLLSNEIDDARKLTRSLIQLNRERKERTKQNELIVDEIMNDNPDKKERPVLFLYDERLKPGVSGIIASRMAEKYKKPAILINPDGNCARGSARSRDGFNILELLDLAADILNQFGGHKEAAGFSVDYKNIQQLEEIILQGARKLIGDKKSDNLESVSTYHIELQPDQINMKLIYELQCLEPFGPGNPLPVFKITAVIPHRIKFLTEGRHVKFTAQNQNNGFEFVAWGHGEFLKKLKSGTPLNLYGSPELNFFRGRDTLQFRVDRLEVHEQC